MTAKLQQIIEKLLLFGAIYLAIDGLIHILNLRLESVHNWPSSATTYATFLNMIYASFVFLAAAISFVMQKNLKKYESLVILSAVWAFLHGSLLIFLDIKYNFVKTFADYSSLYVWLPIYDYYLYFEASLFIIYSILVFIWKKEEIE